jgi:predicted PurR-regulated permease PerM
MAFPERRIVDILLTTMFFAGGCAAIYFARRIILIFAFAVLFTYLINPAVKFLQRHSLFFRNLRAPAVVEVYLAFMIVLAVAGYELAPGLARNTVMVVDEVPGLLEGLSTGDIATQLREKYDWSEEQEFRLRAFLARHKENIQDVVRSVDHFLADSAQ